MAEKAGEIYYDIEANVSGLIQAQQQVNKRLDQMDAKFEQSSRSAGRFEGALNKVGVAIAAAFTIDAAKKIIAIGDEMVTLQARITPGSLASSLTSSIKRQSTAKTACG